MNLIDKLLQSIKWNCLPMPQAHNGPGDLWFSLAYMDRKLAIDVYYEAFLTDQSCRKQNSATLIGWQVLRFTKAMIDSGEAAQVIGRALAK